MYIIFKDKKSKRSHKAVGFKVYLTFLLDDRRIQEAQKHVGPVDPGPLADRIQNNSRFQNESKLIILQKHWELGLRTTH
jgi:hypothetical protein